MISLSELTAWVLTGCSFIIVLSLLAGYYLCKMIDEQPPTGVRPNRTFQIVTATAVITIVVSVIITLSTANVIGDIFDILKVITIAAMVFITLTVVTMDVLVVMILKKTNGKGVTA